MLKISIFYISMIETQKFAKKSFDVLEFLYLAYLQYE